MTIAFFLLFDLLIGNYIYKKILRKNFFDVDTGMGTTHSVYHHDIKKNYITHSAGWGKKKFSFCSDIHGFRNDCINNNNSKIFDIGIIGDSQTVGFGLSYDEMFSTLISKKLKNKRIANLSSSSYSSAIYYSKINYLISNGYKFNEIIVFVDLSDFHDDFVRYKLDGDKILGKHIIWGDENYSITEKFLFFLEKRFKVTNYLIVTTDNFLITKGIKEKKIPYWILNNPRSTITYNYNKKWYLEEENLQAILDNSLSNMEKLHSLLEKNNIPLSIAVFPHPATLKFDIAENLHLKTWKNFCEQRCKTFFNIMTPFFKIKETIGFRDLYFQYYIDGDLHFNENGNKIIAESFLENYKD